MKPLNWLPLKKKNGLWSPFPRTARPKALALAITLFQIMVAVLPSSGFGSSPWAGLETPGLKAHGTTMWTQFVNARECYLTFSFCANGDFLSSSMQFLHFAILYCCHKACALHKSGTEPTKSWSRLRVKVRLDGLYLALVSMLPGSLPLFGSVSPKQPRISPRAAQHIDQYRMNLMNNTWSPKSIDKEYKPLRFFAQTHFINVWLLIL